MPRIHIDGREVEVAPGQTLLHAARKLGIEIPTLCFLERCGPLNSCLVCVVRVTQHGRTRVLPACGARAEDGMQVDSESPQVHELRRTALELLLSDHVGDCLSPCHRICPLDLNIPRMIRQIESEQLSEATATIRHALALPAVLGRLCHAPCQNGCRRSGCGGTASIRELERFVADTDAALAQRYSPALPPPTGRHIAILGAGPTGLAAAYQLRLAGHTCTVFDRQEEPGGSLRRLQPAELSPDVLAGEIRYLTRMGIEFRPRTCLGTDLSIEELRTRHDAVLLAVGELAAGEAPSLGVPWSGSGIQARTNTGQTPVDKVFAAGSAVKPVRQLVRAMSEGQAVGRCIDQFVTGRPVHAAPREFSSVMGRLEPGELELFLRGVNPEPRTPPSRGLGFGFTPIEARRESSRCLHCDCRAAGDCALQHYAQVYGAQPGRFARQRRAFRQELHPGNVLFEPGKCILCGICIEIARQAAEPLGLTFVGRGFDVQVAAPLGHDFADGLQKVAAECVTHCPTGAITFAHAG